MIAARLAVPCVAHALAVSLAAGCTGAIVDEETADEAAPPGAASAPRPTAGTSTPPPGGAAAPDRPGAPPAAPLPPVAADPAPSAGPPDPDSAGRRVLRRMTRFEYDNTVAELLGDTTAPARALDEDAPGVGGFAQGAPLSAAYARTLADVAAAVADRAVATSLRALLPCDPAQTGEEPCARQFVARFGRRAYRRPLATAEVDELMAVYGAVRQQAGARLGDGVAAVIDAMLQSPKFLYLWEIGEPARRDGKVVRLTDHEVASRLSYFLWASMPDARLFEEADAARLQTPEQVGAQARRMLADRRAIGALVRFHQQWLDVDDELERAVRAGSDWKPDLVAALRREMELFLGGWLQGPEADGRFETLLTSPATFVTAPLAALYGLPAVRATEPVAARLDPSQRAGILTRAAFLASHAKPNEGSPVGRGVTLFERLLCGTLPPPPMNVPPLAAPAPNRTLRERLSQHSDTDCARGCHGLFDPLGFGLLNYDQVGRHVTTDAGKPIDASGTVTFPASGRKASFANGVELSRVLAASDEVRGCVARQIARNALGRLEQDGDAASLAAAYGTFAAARFDVRELVAAFTASRTFRYRTPAPEEVLR